MTAIKDHAIYAKTDREAARRYRIHSQRSTRDGHAPDARGTGEISEAERQVLLRHKGTSETRQPLRL